MAITDWPEADRPREKLIQRGPDALTDAELLAIFLRTGVRGKSAVLLAQELLEHFGGLRPLLDSDYDRFCATGGLGTAKFALLKAALEMCRRHLRETLVRGDALTSPTDTRAYLALHLRPREHEVFACLFLDNRHRVIAYQELFTGTIDGASVHPRVVVKEALRHNAAALILAHNHPSGIAEPSHADILITQKLREALKLVDIRVVDHMIIGDREVSSLAEQGHL